MGDDDCKSEAKGKVKTSFMKTQIPLQTLALLMPGLFVAAAWWLQVKELPNETKALKAEVAAMKLESSKNRSRLELHANEFTHINEGLKEIKVTLKDMQKEQRNFMYRTGRMHRRDEDDE